MQIINQKNHAQVLRELILEEEKNETGGVEKNQQRDAKAFNDIASNNDLCFLEKV